nr:uncharacterized protein LOC107435782 isoform X2 [Ziziphus jujuba var. spinosa]
MCWLLVWAIVFIYGTLVVASVCSVGWAQRGTHLAVGTSNGKVQRASSRMKMGWRSGPRRSHSPVNRRKQSSIGQDGELIYMIVEIKSQIRAK